jgi:hypothetical protein
VKSLPVALLALAWFGVACHKKAAHAPCTQDSQCDSDQVCFIDGCGDPARDVRVEVTPSGSSAAFAQDLALSEVHARENLQLPAAPMLEGRVRVRESIDTAHDEPPDTEISIRGQGASKIIPGVQRSFETRFAPPSAVAGPSTLGNDGSYSLPASAGEYSITANAVLNSTSPPLYAQQNGKVLQPGTSARVDFLLEALSPVYTVTVKLRLPPSPPSVDASQMELQAFSDSIKLLPLSQQTFLNAGSTDTFTLLVSPTVRLLPSKSFIVRAGPKEQTVLVPRKTFPVSVSDPTPAPLTFEFGSFGPPVTVTGTIRDSQGSPVPNATVYLDGPTSNGGTFKSPQVLTNEAGNFEIVTLPSAPLNTTLWAIPLSQSSAGILRTSVRIAGDPSIGTFTCPDKVRVRGKIYKVDGTAISGVTVAATPIKALLDKPLPVTGGQTSTGSDSSFELRLDPGIYQLDFIPSDPIPLASRFATVPDPSSSGSSLVQLPDFAFSNGRPITGTVFATDPADQQLKISPQAKIRFFRLTLLPDETQTSLLLAAPKFADSAGSYSVVLPTTR